MFCILDFSAGNSIKYAQAKALEGESEREKKVFKWAVTYLWGVKWVFLLKATPMFFFILEKGRDTERNRHEVSGNGCPFWTGHLLDRFEWANGKVRRFFSLFSALENWFTFLASVLPFFFDCAVSQRAFYMTGFLLLKTAGTSRCKRCCSRNERLKHELRVCVFVGKLCIFQVLSFE